MNREQIQEAIENQLEDGFKGAETALGLSDKQYLPAFYLNSYSFVMHKLRENKKERDSVSEKAYSESKFYEQVSDQIGSLRAEQKRSFKKDSPLWNLFKENPSLWNLLNDEIVGLEAEIDKTKGSLDHLEDEILALNEVYRARLQDATDLAKICLDRSYMEEEQFRTGVRFKQ